MKPHRNVSASGELDTLLNRHTSLVFARDAETSRVEDFMASMPERYRDEFGLVSARQHARVAAARGRRPIHADLFSGANPAGPGICVVAADNPGLLSLISTAIMLEGFNIVRADAYTRRISPDEYEAVDLFWVRRSNPERQESLDDADLAALRSTLLDLWAGNNATRRLRTALSGMSPGASETSVRFRALRGVPRVTLELESNDRPGLLAVVTAALAGEGVEIIESRVRTHGLRVHDYFEIRDTNGSRLNDTKLQRIELAVMTAVDGPGAGA